MPHRHHKEGSIEQFGKKAGEFIRDRIIPKPFREAIKILRSSIHLQLRSLPHFTVEEPMPQVNAQINAWSDRETINLNKRIERHKKSGRRSFKTAAVILGAEIAGAAIIVGVHIITGGASTAILILANQAISRVVESVATGSAIGSGIYWLRQRRAVEVLRDRPRVVSQVVDLAGQVARDRKQAALEDKVATGATINRNEPIALALNGQQPGVEISAARDRVDQIRRGTVNLERIRKDRRERLRSYFRSPGRIIKAFDTLAGLIAPPSRQTHK